MRQSLLRTRTIQLVEIGLIMLAIVSLLVEIFTHEDVKKYSFNEIVNLSQYVILLLAMTVALYRLRQFQKSISGIFCNEKLMIIHCASFVFATFFETSDAVLCIIEVKADLDKETAQRFDLAIGLVAVLKVIGWLVVQILMLIVIVRYGKPLEEDTKTIIFTKLIQVE